MKQRPGSLVGWHLAAVAVTAAGLGLRLAGVRFGYPLLAHPDEPRVVEGALGMLSRGDWHPGMFFYPSLLLDLLRVWLGLHERALVAMGAEAGEILLVDRFVAARVLVALLATATLPVVYDTGRRLLHPLAGLAAALLLAAAPLHVEHSFTATVDAPVALWASLTLWAAVRLRLEGPRLRWYVLGGACAGLAVGSKYIGFATLLPLLLAHFAVVRVRGGWRDPRLLLACLLVPLVFLATTPYALLDTDRFKADVLAEGVHYSKGHWGNEATGRFALVDYVRSLVREGLGLLPAVLGVVGALGLARGRRWVDLWMLLSFPLVLLLFVGSYKVWFARNAIGALPGLTLCAGAGAWLSWELLRARWSRPAAAMAAALLVVAAAALPLAASAAHVRAVTLPDARWASWLWLRENVPAGSRIGLELLTAPFEQAGERFQVEELTPHRVGELAREPGGLEIVLLSGKLVERVRRGGHPYPELVEGYERFMARHELVRVFEADGRELSGATVLVYRMR